LCAAHPFGLKLPSECGSAEAVDRDIAAVSADPRFWLAATVPVSGGGERIVGFASGNIEYGFRMQYDAFVNVGILPEWCGGGLGRRMHDEIAAWAQGYGVRRLSAAVQAPNHAGRAFAAALGYDEEVTMRGYSLIDGRMVDRLRLGKLLVE
jgi:RimJ/RimL family protein N-acetyltransferase